MDPAYGNDLAKQRSTTGYVFAYSWGAVVYRSKTQYLTALGSIEAEFIAAVTAAKTAKYIRLVLCKLGFRQSSPTPIYKDNRPIIDIVASQKPAMEQTRHIDIGFFAIQDWTHKSKDIQLSCVPGVLTLWMISLSRLVGSCTNAMQDISWDTTTQYNHPPLLLFDIKKQDNLLLSVYTIEFLILI